MKIRKGFVSNSSSSSYIIGIAKVLDIEKVKKIIKNSYDAELVLIEAEYDKRVESFDCNEVRIKDSKIGDTVVHISAYQDMESDDDGYTDYNVDYDECSQSGQKLIDDLEISGAVGNIEVSYGAGWNG